MQDANGSATDRREMLRIKLKSLAAEARIIRREERRARPSANGVYGLREELHGHRVGVVRSEARHSHIAYGLIRGRKFEQMERPNSSAINPKRIKQLIEKYGPKSGIAEQPQWLKAA